MRWRERTGSSERVRGHFQRKAFSFDRVYEEEHPLQRLLRPGLARRLELALAEVARHSQPRVLDVGCGSGRVGEAALEASAGEYVGVDFSEPMLALARERLSRFGAKAILVQGDFLDAPLEGPFDIALALGVFDYQPEPHLFVRRMFELNSDVVIASFPRWNWVKGPIRKLRYEVLNDCPIFDYTERELRLMFGAAGFAGLDFLHHGRGGFVVRATRAASRPLASVSAGAV
jgi:SAM-dependent methyltransferase